MLYFFLLHILTATVFCILLLFKREEHGHCAKVMSLVMLIIVVMTLKFMEPIMLTENNWQLIGYGDLLFRFGAMAVAPVTGIYFIVATTNKVKRWQWLALVGPALVVWAFMVGSYLVMGEAERKAEVFFAIRQDLNDYHSLAVTIYRIAVGPCYIFLCRYFIVAIHLYGLFRVLVYQRSLLSYHSDDKSRQLIWSFAALVVLETFVIILIVPFANESIVTLQQGLLNYKIIISVFSEVYIVLLGLAAWYMRYPAASFVADAGDDGVLYIGHISARSRSTLPFSGEIEKKWNEIYIRKTIFLQPGVTIDDVAREMHTDRNSLLQFLVRKYGVNFYRGTQVTRIQNAKELLESRPGLSLEQVAQQCGYPDVATFTRSYRFVEHAAPKR